ncbi:LemA family protein [Candidatus Peribacteria bacterium]|nr:LemA family protein [Candidatus Peribacteria bacterium]
MKSRSTWILLAIVAVLTVWLWSGYNSLVTAKAGVEGAWAKVETQYQRRIDLVPNLVSTVKGAAAFEQSTFTAITEARSQWQGAGTRDAKVAAASGFDSALSRLLVTVEAYPQLQATQAFRDLMTQLEGTENRIATARRDYNTAVQGYNVLVKRFPKNILAGMFGFTPEAMFASDDGADKAPAVQF